MKEEQAKCATQKSVERAWKVKGVGLALAGFLALVGGIAFAPIKGSHAQQAPSYSVVYTFQGGTDGSNPQAGVVADSSGNLYGTTPFGGLYGYGTVFKVDPTGSETILYNFTGGPDGRYPYTGVILDASGNLYGTTPQGGDGYGVIFKIDASGNQTVLHSFVGGQDDGADPEGGLLRNASGELYGTTTSGGTKSLGTVFKLSPAGNLIILHSFAGQPTDGVSPFAGLVRDSSGNLYGTTQSGGASSYGAIFKVGLHGTETVLFSFDGEDGGFPVARLIRDLSGNLYGTTPLEGTAGCGVAFELASSGTENLLHTFLDRADGCGPIAGLTFGLADKVYGAASGGGSFAGICESEGGCGVIYGLTAQGAETVLYTFTGGSDGASPDSNLLVTKGALYGTADRGGNTNGACGPSGCGVVFKMSPQ